MRGNGLLVATIAVLAIVGVAAAIVATLARDEAATVLRDAQLEQARAERDLADARVALGVGRDARDDVAAAATTQGRELLELRRRVEAALALRAARAEASSVQRRLPAAVDSIEVGLACDEVQALVDGWTQTDLIIELDGCATTRWIVLRTQGGTRVVADVASRCEAHRVSGARSLPAGCGGAGLAAGSDG